MTLRRYEPMGTFRALRMRFAGVVNESVPKDAAVAVESFLERGVRVRVAV